MGFDLAISVYLFGFLLIYHSLGKFQLQILYLHLLLQGNIVDLLLAQLSQGKFYEDGAVPNKTQCSSQVVCQKSPWGHHFLLDGH